MGVQVMYLINAAKYAQHPDLQFDLLKTGTAKIIGALSITWICQNGSKEQWSTWNGLIQTRIREELRPPSDRTPGVLESIVEQFDKYRIENGDVQLPLPTAPQIPSANEKEDFASEAALFKE